LLVPNRQAAAALVHAQGEALWRTATHRAQHPRQDRRPARHRRPRAVLGRLSMALALRPVATPLRPGCDGTRRADPIPRIHLARHHSTHFAAGVRKLLVTGFDPFTLDADIRIGNPSGANALTLDGQRGRSTATPTRSRPSVSRSATPTSTRDMVENALAPHYRPGPQHAGSRHDGEPGPVGIFDLEVFNGRRRSVSSIGDNNNLWAAARSSLRSSPPACRRGRSGSPRACSGADVAGGVTTVPDAP
jgi:hypothetical protein